jgi:hypothetical protein
MGKLRGVHCLAFNRKKTVGALQQGGRVRIKQRGQCCRCLHHVDRQDGREGILSIELEVKILGAAEVLF